MPVGIGDVVRLAGLECDVALGLEREAGERREQHHDASMNDVAAVATTVSSDEPYECSNERFLMDRASCADTFIELLNDRPRDEAAQRVCDQRTRRPHPDGQQCQPDDQTEHGG